MRGGAAWFRPWAELEQDAVSLRSYQPLLVPGLLQTEEYARAILNTGGLVPPSEVDQIVASRIDRQAVLRRDAHPSSSRCSTRWCSAGRSATAR